VTEPRRPPAWQALEIGPGALPPDQVSGIDRRPPVGALVRASAGATGPSAVLGSFDDEPRRPSRRVSLGALALAVAVGIVVALAMWSPSIPPFGGSAELQAGECLSPGGGLSVIPIDCSSPDVEFRVVARFGDSTNPAGCASLSSDVVLVTRDSAVLCLNYVAVVGDCLYAGSGGRAVGKAPCRTQGATGSAPGLYRVLAVLANTIDEGDCPDGTLQAFVHLTSPEVLCLGAP
jgi:hypothetical protein